MAVLLWNTQYAGIIIIGATVIWQLTMDFVSRLVSPRNTCGLTQQAVANMVELHFNQFKRYEAGTVPPTLETLVRLAIALHVSLDTLVTNDGDHGPSDDFKMRFEATNVFSDREKLVTKECLDSLILKPTANRLAS